MTRTLFSIPSVSDSLSVYSDLDKIAEYLGASLEQGEEPDIMFEKGGRILVLCGLQWASRETRKFYIMGKSKGSWQFENPNREIGELKSANKAIADRCNRLEKEKNEAVNKLGEVISKDLFLQAIAAVNGKILK